jgi:adenine-specific DNA-methyltransferase
MDNEKMDGLSMDIEQADREKLQSVFPQCFTEGKLDIDRLLNLCGEYITDDFEKYSFTWKGKSDCVQLAGKRSAGTLRPCRSESVDWDNTKNLYIEGDNLEVLKLLQTSYFRKVKMIYIDPPYNTGNDFVYADDFADPLARYKEVTQQTTKSNPETMGRFHTNWLNMMYPRLRLAANLLRDDGVCFISIDDNEIENLKKLCNEIFGEENFVAQVIVQTNPRGRTFDRFIAKTHEYVLVYTKSSDVNSMHEIPKDEKAIAGYQKEDEGGKYRLLELRNRNPVFNRTNRPLMFYPFYADPVKLDVSLTPTSRHTVEIYPRNSQGEDGCWTWGLEKAKNETSLLVANHANTGKWSVFRKDYLDGSSLYTKAKSIWLEKGMNHENGKEIMGELFGKTPFDFPKAVDYIKKCLQLGTFNADDIVLDFFSGSATTAHAVMQLNAEDGGTRRFIMIQLPEKTDNSDYPTICEIGKERIRRAGAKIKELQSNQIELGEAEKAPLDIGFRVFKLDSSNLKVWDDSPIGGENALDLLQARIAGMLDILKPDRTDEDVVYEVMMKLGQDLCEPIVPIALDGGRKVYGVGAEVKFIVCLAENVTPEDAAVMADYAPGRIVFADECFTNSTDKSNVKLTLRDKGIAIRVL